MFLARPIDQPPVDLVVNQTAQMIVTLILFGLIGLALLVATGYAIRMRELIFPLLGSSARRSQ